MTVSIKPGNLVTFLSTDVKPTTGLAILALGIETDTGLIYWWNGSAWAIITEKSVTETLVGKTLTSPTINTPTLTTPIINGMVQGVLAKTSNYTLLTTDTVITADASGGAFTLTLPTAVGAKAVYTIKRTDILASSNLLTIATTSSQTIDSATNHYLWPGEFVQFISDNANWQILNRTTIGPTSYFQKGSTLDRRVCAPTMSQYDGTATFLVSSTSPAANTLWAMPFVVPVTTKYDTISFRITTNSTLGNSRAGIYRSTGNSYPGALIFDTGSISTVSGAGAAPVTKDTTITAGLQVFAPGLYWLAYEQDTATGQMMSIGTRAIYGMLGNTTSWTATLYGYSVAHTFGALPDPYTAGATVLNTLPAVGAPVPSVGLRPI